MNYNTEENTSKFKSFSVLKFVIYGFLIGLLFPIIAWSLNIISSNYSFELISIRKMHFDNPLIYILDIIPLLFLIIAFLISDKIKIERKLLKEEISDKNKIIEQYTSFAKQLGGGQIIDTLESTKNTNFEKSLQDLTEDFITINKTESEKNWISNGKDIIMEILRKHNDIEPLAHDVLENLIKYTDTIQGSFYIFDDEEQMLVNASTYAYNRRKFTDQKFKIGQGLIGQAAYEKGYIYRKNLPDNYTTITSGLIGEKNPKTLLITPLTGDEKIQGVLEIASIKDEMPQRVILFLNELSDIIGQTIFNFKANITTKKLLQDSQNLTDRLQKNENELRKSANQMELTQIELKKSNVELASKISEVEQAQKRLYALLENASEVITIYNMDGIVQYVSPSVKSILGFEPDEMIGINRFDRGDKILQEAFNELTTQPDASKTFEYQYTNKNKKRVWLETSGTNLVNNPAINGIIFNTRDITVQKEAETAKRLSSEMQALSENSPDMIIRIGQEGNFYYANPMTKEFVGVNSADLIGNNIKNIELDKDIANFFSNVINKTKSAKKEIQTETTFEIEDIKRIVQFNSIPEYNTEGEISTFLFVAHDITERKEIELEIENKNKNITESINYAQRIQSAIVPTEDYIRRYLPNSFFFYEPRDVVSGDLPWLYSNDNETYFAAIDCTGHGVPGTLLSFIGYFTLNSIVTTEEKLDLGEILDELHYRVRKTLKQDSPDSKARDGMDIAICKINHKDSILEFAGAHRPLFFLRDGKLERYRGDRKAVGGKPMGKKEEKKFTTHKINIRKKDKIFIFTDGLPDQIGGEEGRKYQAGRLQEEIISNNNFSMKEYNDFFVTQLNEWQEGYKQIDDILLIGIEI